MSDTTFNPQRAARALQIVRGAFDLDPVDRVRWIARETGSDLTLRAEVERLLAADHDAAGPLDRPLLQQVSQLDEEIDPRLGRRSAPTCCEHCWDAAAWAACIAPSAAMAASPRRSR